MKRLTLKAASQHTGVSKSKIWRAVNDGTLKAGKGRTSGGQEAWLVRLDDLEQWTQQHLADSEEVLEDLEEGSFREAFKVRKTEENIIKTRIFSLFLYPVFLG